MLHLNRRLKAVVVGLLVSGLAGPAFGTLLANYKMNEADTITSLVDSVAGYNAAVTAGQPIAVTGPTSSVTRGVMFDTTNGNDNAKAPISSTNLQLTGDYTWAFWAKAASTQQAAASFFCKSSSSQVAQWQLYAGGGSGFSQSPPYENVPAKSIYVEHPGKGWHTGILLTDIAGAWHHIAVTRTGTTMTAYLDGVLKATGEFSAALGTGSATFNIGYNRRTGSTVNYNGAMADLGIWDNALTQSQIQGIVLNGVPEPSALALLGLGGLVCIRRRR
jgi:hypothetical protein